ncbi:Hypothetical protein Tpal_1912 [Trichococcus palustris]|uniref:Uncharacterized protein n=1 Tax=Trichococcus palustris TaxID=140314 RepID=A0A143YS23_9LACT|nr:hypothetical protein [Trichococcus palustris]CZQ95577.1 Hypothetical protein Tpal_1912 [Trichococcus palustris]SFK96932.1 hypothetical protein SAMN04488076_11144 [Trichococcus palustris]
MENDLFISIPIKNSLHPKFLMLRDNSNFIFHRHLLNEWFSGFQDRDNKIVKEFQTTFHSSFWEIFLFKVFQELNFNVDFTHNRPDFILKSSNLGTEIYVEATVANIRYGGDPESSRTFENISSMFTPPQLIPDFEQELDECIVRYSNSLRTKSEKYKKDYRNCSWVSNQNPYVIALSSYDQVNYGREYIFGIIALLYGMYYSKDNNTFIKKDFIRKKETNAKISLDIFNSKEYDDVSAVIFTSNCTIGKLTALVRSQNENYKLNDVFNLYQDFLDESMRFKVQYTTTESPEILTDGLWVFHNPNAKNKLSVFDFWDRGITQICIEDGKVHMYGNYCTTISRMDITSILTGVVWPEIETKLQYYNEKVEIEFVDFYHGIVN